MALTATDFEFGKAVRCVADCYKRNNINLKTIIFAPSDWPEQAGRITRSLGFEIIWREYEHQSRHPTTQ